MWLSHPLVQYRTAAAADQVLQPVAQQTVLLKGKRSEKFVPVTVSQSTT